MTTIRGLTRVWKNRNVPDGAVVTYQETLNYIRSVAAPMGVNIDNLHIDKVFFGNTLGQLPLDKERITTTLLRLRSMHDGNRLSELPENVRELIDSIEIKIDNSKLMSLERARMGAAEDLEAVLANVSNSMDRLAAATTDLRTAELNDHSAEHSRLKKNLSAGIMYALNEPFWLPPRINVSENGSMSVGFSTAPEVYVVGGIHDGPPVNLGRFTVHLDTAHRKCLHLKITRLHHNKSVSRYYHPHISRAGEPCWGNAHSVVSNAKLEWDVTTLLKKTKRLLQSYCGDNPFTPLRGFRSARAQGFVSHGGYPSMAELRVVLKAAGQELNDG